MSPVVISLRQCVSLILFASVVASVVACSAPGPTPQAWAAQEVPIVPLDPAQQAELTALEEKAHLALLAGRTDDAIELARIALRMAPHDAWARAIHGRAIATAALGSTPPDLDEMELAEGELLLARRLAPDNADVQLFHAWFLEADGHLTGALAVLDALLRKDPGHLHALRAASRLHFELGEERAALPLLAALTEKDPRDAASVFRLAHCRLSLAESIAAGDTDEAIRLPADAARRAFIVAGEVFRRYEDLKPSDIGGPLGEAHARFRAAQLLAAAKREQAQTEITEVRQILARAARLDPSSPAPEHSLGVILEFLEEPGGLAREAYARALVRDPNHVPSLLNLAACLAESGDAAAAVPFCRRALALDLPAGERDRLTKFVDDVGR